MKLLIYVLLQTTAGLSVVLLLGTLGMMLLTVGLIVFIVLHQRRVKKFNERIQAMEQEQQRLLLNASIKLQKKSVSVWRPICTMMPVHC